MQKNKFIIYCGLFELLTGLILGGCGKAEENISRPLTEPEANSTAPDVIYTEPPLMELQSVSDEQQSAFLRSGGYNWTFPFLYNREEFMKCIWSGMRINLRKTDLVESRTMP